MRRNDLEKTAERTQEHNEDVGAAEANAGAGRK